MTSAKIALSAIALTSVFTFASSAQALELLTPEPQLQALETIQKDGWSPLAAGKAANGRLFLFFTNTDRSHMRLAYIQDETLTWLNEGETASIHRPQAEMTPVSDTSGLHCIPVPEARKTLAKWQQNPVVDYITDEGKMLVSLFASAEKGSWSLTIQQPGTGLSCILVRGGGYMMNQKYALPSFP